MAVDPDPFRILIVSSPKTGNTWLKYLLHQIYRLPIVNVESTLTRQQLLDFGNRWIGHQHLFPSEPLLEAFRELNVHVVTTVRHPADVLVSYFHHIRSLASRGLIDSRAPEAIVLSDGPKPGAHTLQYVKDGFGSTLLFSAAWLTHTSRVVRYEELKSDPVSTLIRLTQSILPAEASDIERAVALCEINALREQVPELAHHFRKGTSQFTEKEELLPQEILDVLAREEPYREINATLGYSYTQIPKLVPFDYRTVNPLHGHDTFSNGVPISHGIVKLYLDLNRETRERWPDPADVGKPDSFFAHLLEPIDEGRPVITRLADMILRRRTDLQQAYPNHRTTDRWRFVSWFIYTGKVEYRLHQALLEPVVHSVLNAQAQIQPPARSTLVAQPPAPFVRAVTIARTDGSPVADLEVGEWVVVTAEIEVGEADAGPTVRLRLIGQDRREYYSCTTRLAPTPLPASKSRLLSILLQLNPPPGDYQLAVGLIGDGSGRGPGAESGSAGCRLTLVGNGDWSGLACCHGKVISGG